MKPSIVNRFPLASIIAFVFSLMLTANAFAAVDMFLQIEGISGEGTYKAKVDPATGNVEIKNVPAGRYKTTLLISQAAMASRMSSSDGNTTAPSTIEISSFSWGVSNSSSMGKGSGMGAGKVSMQDMSVTPGSTTAGSGTSGSNENPTESVSSTLSSTPTTGGFTHKTFPLLTVRKAGSEQKEYYKVVFEDIIISSIAPTGGAEGSAVKAGYNVKANVKV